MLEIVILPVIILLPIIIIVNTASGVIVIGKGNRPARNSRWGKIWCGPVAKNCWYWDRLEFAIGVSTSNDRIKLTKLQYVTHGAGPVQSASSFELGMAE
jgi:hypothetical protein